MNIILNFDPSVANAPPGFMFAIYQAAAIYDALFTTSLTVTIDVGYGEIDGENLPAGDASSSLTDYNTVSYAALAAALPAADALPASDPTNGTGTYEIAAPLQAMLGLGGGNPVEYIGVAAVPLDVTPGTAPAAGQYDLTGLALHEISEVLGRYALGGLGGDYAALDLLRYVAPGTLALASPAASALSVDGGAALSGDFNNAGSGIDLGDWAGYSGDAYGAALPGGTLQLSQIDLAEMAALGYAETANAIGGGMNFLNHAGPDTFYAGASGAILVMEQAAGGMVPAMVLQNGGALAAPGTGVIGTASNILGTSGNDVFFRTASADLYVYEFNVGGIATAATWLTNADGSIGQAAAGTSVIGTASNLYGTLGTDVVFQTITGGLYVFEYNAAGASAAATWLVNPNGNDETAAWGTSVIGGATNLYGTGGTDIVFQTMSGSLYAYEYNAIGVSTAATWLVNPDGSVDTAAPGTSVIGGATDLFGLGGQDVVFRTEAGQLYVYEYNTAGVAIAAAWLRNPDGSVITAAPGTSVLGTANNLLGDGGHDLLLRTSANTAYALEFNPMADLVGATWLTNGPGAPDETFAPGSQITMSGSNQFGMGGTDFLVRQPGMAPYIIESNHAGAVVGARWA